MNPTYEVGDVVQIISEEEVRSHPTDNFGNFILAHSRYGVNNSFHREKTSCLRLSSCHYRHFRRP